MSYTTESFEIPPSALGIGFLVLLGIAAVIVGSRKSSNNNWPTSVDRMNDMHDEK